MPHKDLTRTGNDIISDQAVTTLRRSSHDSAAEDSEGGEESELHTDQRGGSYVFEVEGAEDNSRIALPRGLVLYPEIWVTLLGPRAATRVLVV